MTGTGSAQPNLRGATAFPARFWALAVAGGVATGFAAGLLMRLLRAVQDLAWHQATFGDFAQAVAAASWSRRVAVVTAAGAAVALVRMALRDTGGGHGPGVDEAIWFGAGRLPVWHTTVQSVLSIVIVALGASLGREAAPKQMGALLGGVLARGAALSASHARLLAACGAGAGIAAVYNVPLGGALFALEVLLGTVSLPLIAPALVMAGTATVTAWSLLPATPTYLVPAYAVSPSLVAYALIAGPIAGAGSVVVTRLISWADDHRPSRRLGLIGAPILVFAGLGLLALPLPQILGNGKDDVQAALVGHLGGPVLLALVLLKPVATAACLGSGAPGGLFTPILSIGAALGALLGTVWMHVWPGSPLGAFTAVGTAAVLAGTTLGPISAAVLVLELAPGVDGLIVPIILAASGAVIVAWRLDGRSIYSCRVHRGRQQAERVDEPHISASAGPRELLLGLLGHLGQARSLAVVDHRGAVLGHVSEATVRERLGSVGPLETAAAHDFVSDARRPGTASPEIALSPDVGAP